jgi:hypothetical protein
MAKPLHHFGKVRFMVKRIGGSSRPHRLHTEPPKITRITSMKIRFDLVNELGKV